MACTISLPLWPHAINCISWSQENLIAIGGGDQIAILTPRLSTPGSNGTYWDASIITANEFSRQEVPLVDPLTFRHFSLGEELSLRHVHSLEWSPPGLSKFGRCMLAVLSANHVLSLWSCDGPTNVDSNWQRTVVVNHALKDHYSRIEPGQQPPDRKQRELCQVHQRVRTFAWAPDFQAPHVRNPSQSLPYSRLSKTHQVFAVSTEAGEILILRLRSPHDILAPSKINYHVDVVYTVSVESQHSPETADRTTNGQPKTSPSNADDGFVQFLAWSEWFLDDNGECYAHLAYISKGRLWSRRILLDHTASDIQIKTAVQQPNALLPESTSSVHGPLKFVPGTELLIAFADNRVLCVDTAAALTGTDAVTSHHLDDRWDDISGVAFTQPNRSLPNIHIASHLSSAGAETTMLPLPLSEDDVSVRPLWQRAIKESRSSYSAEHRLAGNVADRVCGMGNSPLGDYIITACTLGPSDCVTYPQPSEARAVLNITNELSLSDGWTLNPNLPSGVSVETLLFSLQQLAEIEGSEVELELALQAVMKRQTSQAEATNGESWLAFASSSTSQPDVDGLVQQFRHQIYTQPDIQSERASLVFDFVYKSRPKMKQIMTSVLERMADMILDLPIEFATRGEISQMIRANYATIKSKLNLASKVGEAEAGLEDASEECSICGKPVAFESLKWARCEKGHQFSRCGLTLFAIQEAGLSKHCTICGMQYLNEWLMPEITYVDDRETGTSDRAQLNGHGIISNGTDATSPGYPSDREPDYSLARVLFASFDCCIYCGGRFFA